VSTPPTKTIHERMVAILAALPAIGKDSRNEQQRFMYRGFDDVMAALNPLLAKHGVFVVPDVIDRVPAQRATKSGNVMFEVNLHVRFTFYGAGGDSLTASAWGEGTDSGDKSTNKAMTMAFKNVLNQSFAISTREDIDADAHTPEESVSNPVPAAAEQKNTGPSLKDIEALCVLAEERGGDREGTLALAQTAKRDGILPEWYADQLAKWNAQPVMSDIGRRAIDAQVAGAKAAQARAAKADADAAPKAAA
jgi:hypothetical protein